MRKAAKAAKAAKSARLTAAGPLVRQHNAALRLKRSSQAMVQAKAPPELNEYVKPIYTSKLQDALRRRLYITEQQPADLLVAHMREIPKRRLIDWTRGANFYAARAALAQGARGVTSLCPPEMQSPAEAMRAAFPEQFDFVPSALSFRETKCPEVDEGRQLKLALFKDVPRMTWASERVEASVLWLPDLRHGISSVMQVLYHVFTSSFLFEWGRVPLYVLLPRFRAAQLLCKENIYRSKATILAHTTCTVDEMAVFPRHLFSPPLPPQFANNALGTMHLLRLRPRTVINLPGAHFSDIDPLLFRSFLQWLHLQRRESPVKHAIRASFHFLEEEQLESIDVDLNQPFSELSLQDILRLATFFQGTSALDDMGLAQGDH